MVYKRDEDEGLRGMKVKKRYLFRKCKTTFDFLELRSSLFFLEWDFVFIFNESCFAFACFSNYYCTIIIILHQTIQCYPNACPSALAFLRMDAVCS